MEDFNLLVLKKEIERMKVLLELNNNIQLKIVKKLPIKTNSALSLLNYTEDRCIIYIRDNENSGTYDYIFAIAHECRHIHQLNNGIKCEPYNIALSTTDYNMQDAEIDANAFGYAYMQLAFGVSAQFKGLDPKVRAIIIKRANEILKEEVEEKLW